MCCFVLQGLCVSVSIFVCVCVCNLSGSSDQEEQWATRTANVSHVWCATRGTFIMGGKSNSHTCMQCHPHDTDEWGRYGQLRFGQSLNWPGTSRFPLPPTDINVYTNFHSQKTAAIFPPVCKGKVCIEGIRQVPPLWHWYRASCDSESNHAHKHPNTQHPPVPPPPTPTPHCGPRILFKPSNCTFWAFTILTSYASAAGLHGRDQLKWKGPHSSFLLRPPKLWTQIELPPSPDVSRGGGGGVVLRPQQCVYVCV